MSSQAEELLDSLSANDIALYTANPETEEHIVIDANRFITVPESLRKIAVQYDHDIETVTFDCPRYWDEHDLSEMIPYVNYMRSDGEVGSRRCTNITVDETNPNIFHFDWTVSQNTTMTSGDLVFLVCIKKVDSEGNEQNHWNSELNKEMYISEGLEVVDTIVERYPDVITQILTQLENVGVSSYTDITNKPMLNGVTIDGDKTLEDYNGMTVLPLDKLTDYGAQISVDDALQINMINLTSTVNPTGVVFGSFNDYVSYWIRFNSTYVASITIPKNCLVYITNNLSNTLMIYYSAGILKISYDSSGNLTNYILDAYVSKRHVQEELSYKLESNQGTENTGKVMTVDADGNVTPEDVPYYYLDLSENTPKAFYDACMEIFNRRKNEDGTIDFNKTQINVHTKGTSIVFKTDSVSTSLGDFSVPIYVSFNSGDNSLGLYAMSTIGKWYHVNLNSSGEVAMMISFTDYVNAYQGTSNAGKFLVIDDSGKVKPKEITIPDQEVFVINMTPTTSAGGTYNIDKTKEEIIANIDKAIILNESKYGDSSVKYVWTGMISASDTGGIWINAMSYKSGTNLATCTMHLNSSGQLYVDAGGKYDITGNAYVKIAQGTANKYSTLVTDISGEVVPTPTYIQYVADGNTNDIAGYAVNTNAIIYTKGGSFKAFGVDVTLPSKEAPYPVCLINPYPDTMGWFRWIVTPFARYAVDAANAKFYKESPNMEFITSNDKWTVFGSTSTYSRALEENIIYFCTTDVTLYSTLTSGEADSQTSTFDLKMGDAFYLGINSSIRTLYFINKNPNYESIDVDAAYAPMTVTVNNSNYLDVINIPSGKETVLNASQVTSTQLLLENGKTYMCGKSVKISLGGSYYDKKSRTNVTSISLPEGDLFKFTVSESIYTPGFYVDSYFTGTKIFISTDTKRLEYSYASGVNPYSLTINQSSGSTTYNGNTAVTLDLTGYQTTADLTTDDANTLVEEVFG